MKLIECVPNFSEGRDMEVVHAIRDRIAAVAGVSILHVTSDASHNRSFITFVAPAETMPDAAFAAIRAARDRIDISVHAGVHPRIGAADVVPFVPLDGATMDDCVAIARAVGERVGNELGIPVYLYERAATRSTMRNLADVRRGGFEGLRDSIRRDPERAPDFGPARVHPSFGAVAIGARPFLVAFNVYVGAADAMPIAKEVARAVRQSSGGLPCVKALALEVDSQAQVSMNLVDTERTSLSVAFDAVEREIRARGGEVTWSEIIGLVPERVAFDVAAHRLRLRDSLSDHVLEHRILRKRERGYSLHDYVASVAGGNPSPGGGSVAAVAGALAAALTGMVGALTLGRPRYKEVEDEMRGIVLESERLSKELESLAARDAEAYASVTDARRLPSAEPHDAAHRARAIQGALFAAARVPVEVARLAERVTTLTYAVAQRGNSNVITDAGVAALMANAACTAAAYNVRINAKALGDAEGARELADSALALAASVERRTKEIADLVNAALS
ncbi:MAG: glutamate formimidoyltransferase [Gemmatimonadaceae bacterium]